MYSSDRPFAGVALLCTPAVVKPHYTHLWGTSVTAGVPGNVTPGIDASAEPLKYQQLLHIHHFQVCEGILLHSVDVAFRQRLCLLIFWLSCIFDAEVKEAWKQFWVDFVIYNILRKSSNVPESFRLRLHPPFGRVRPWFSHPAGNCPRGRGRPRLSVILFRVARASWHYLIAVCKRFSDFYNFDTLKTVNRRIQ